MARRSSNPLRQLRRSFYSEARFLGMCNAVSKGPSAYLAYMLRKELYKGVFSGLRALTR